MIGVFASLRGFIKIKAICIDNPICKLHYRFTVLCLVAFSVVVASRQYIGDPIICNSGKPVDKDLLNAYCWIFSTFTVESRLTDNHQSIQPGVSRFSECGDTLKFHLYWWVSFFFMFQAILFYLPRYIWKTLEGGRVQMLVTFLDKPKNKERRVKSFVRYFTENSFNRRWYYVRYVACESFYFVNVVTQIILIDHFLGGQFSSYGLDVLIFSSLNPYERTDPIARVFPRMTKCTYKEFSAAGSVNIIDAICVLPSNGLNEYLIVVLWFWMVCLSFVAGLLVIYRIALAHSYRMRLRILQARSCEDVDRLRFVERMQTGDWFLLYQLCKNIDQFTFRKIVDELSERFTAVSVKVLYTRIKQ